MLVDLRTKGITGKDGKSYWMKQELPLIKILSFETESPFCYQWYPHWYTGSNNPG